MVNTAKYFALLENLSFNNALAKRASTNSTTHSSQYSSEINGNLKILEKYVQLDIKKQLQELCDALKISFNDYGGIDVTQTINKYIISLIHVLHTLTKNINFQSDAKEDLISVAHLRLCIQTTQELSYYALRCQLHIDFYNSPVFNETHVSDDFRCVSALLLLAIQFFTQLLTIRQLHIANAMELVQRDLLAAIIGLRIQQLSTDQSSRLNSALTYMWENESKADFFHHVLLLKATPQLCASLAQELHQQLLGKLSLPHGFASLVAALQSKDTTHTSEIVAHIVAQRGYSQRFQLRLINQIFDFCRLQLADVNILITGVLSLRRLYELNETNRQHIEQILFSHWQPVVAPEDLINGLIIWEHSELCERIRIWQQLFCSSSVACLPSILLVEYIPLFLHFYPQLPEALAERQAVANLILRCLDNREIHEELPALLQRLFSGQMDGNPIWKTRVVIVPAAETDHVIVKVANVDQKQEQDQCRVLPALLIAGSDHALSCKVFLALLRLIVKQFSASQGQSPMTELLANESELADFLQANYQLKLGLLVAVDQLVWHEALKVQLAGTHSKQFIQLVIEFLEQRLTIKQESAQEADQTLVLILLLLQEILERRDQLQHDDSIQRLQHSLQQLSMHAKQPVVKNAVLPLLSLLNGERQTSQETSTEVFQKARDLIEERQPHLQVYGIQIMLNGIRKKDPTFTSQAHRILALALTTLKNKESYTFLNCVRLFVALVHIMESQVLDMLSDEYLSETADMDYRLVVGEAILKSAQELGPLLYRYKAVLLNCFMHGASSPSDEFRSSGYANLAQLCRLLAYQVHSFFQELMQLVDAELSTGRYLPSKRGALLVLAELLAGMENLLDYQEMLLPIYRLLRTIEAAETCDAQMRQHAANGLKTLNEKCRELLSSQPVEQLQKEIKVLGIKETADSSKQSRRHILELN